MVKISVRKQARSNYSLYFLSLEIRYSGVNSIVYYAEFPIVQYPILNNFAIFLYMLLNFAANLFEYNNIYIINIMNFRDGHLQVQR